MIPIVHYRCDLPHADYVVSQYYTGAKSKIATGGDWHCQNHLDGDARYRSGITNCVFLCQWMERPKEAALSINLSQSSLLGYIWLSMWQGDGYIQPPEGSHFEMLVSDIEGYKIVTCERLSWRILCKGIADELTCNLVKLLFKAIRTVLFRVACRDKILSFR